ncbi:Copia-like retrotransposon [Artemisia annua]|uniref:Copia-like retrotransposon n=1 Tax=Artemisia annua TaxID=35608 RepID=A0A2U1NB12_ARTAN|nr:Copia-like retrotransposon [Artemisia annua]
MDASSSVINLRMMNQEVVKLDRFDRCTYTRWVDKMKFLLILLNVYYVLDPTLAPIPSNPEPVPGESSKKRISRNDSHKAKMGVTKNFKKSAPSKRSFKCHVCGETGHFARECKDRKSRTNEVNMVNTEIAEMVAQVHLDDGDDLVG